MKIILIGPPGSGKGSQARLIQKNFNIPHISTGNIFRIMMNEETSLGKEIFKYMSEAKLVPDDLVIKVMKEYLNREEFKNNFLLDGFPRTLEQAEQLENIVDIDIVILLDTHLKIVQKRVLTRMICPYCGDVYNTVSYSKVTCNSCGATLKARKDDNAAIIKERFKEYELLTKPLIKYYKDKNKLKTIDGDQPIKVIFDTIKKMLVSDL